MAVVFYRPDMRRGPQLHVRGRSRDMVTPADQAAQRVRERADEALDRYLRRYHDQRAVAAVLPEAFGPRDAGTVEGFLQVLVKPLVQVPADVVVAVGPGEADDVDGEYGAHLAVHRELGGPGQGQVDGVAAAVRVARPPGLPGPPARPR